MPLTTLSFQITPTGISAPSYAEILQSLIESFQIIYGSDVYIAADSQDGQLLAVFASAINDCNNSAIALYNSFSPTYAQGTELSSLVKINGIERLAASYSTVDVVIIGVTGTIISNGSVKDANGNVWDLPTTVTIPDAGTITVTATAQEAGDIVAAPDTVTIINTPTLGWQTVNNPSAGTTGAPIETDAALRQRQAVSTAISAETVLEGIYATLANLSGVEKLQVYENDTGITDSNGIPGHSISVVIEGGDATTIAEQINDKKNPGTGTYGTTEVLVFDSNGVPNTINFYRPIVVDLTMTITINRLTGYTSAIGTAIVQAVSDYISGFAIGQDSLLSKLYGVADNAATPSTFDVTSITQARDGDPETASNITIAFNELANCPVANIVLVTP